jgi:membrane associated rhomboid family serine protease
MVYLQDGRPPREPFLVAPASVLWLIGVILAAHAGRVLLPGELPDLVLEAYAFIPARYAGLPEFARDTLFQQSIGFVSHIFLHANFTHAGVNCLWLLAFGPLVARRLKTLKFILFFLFCGIAGAFAQLIVYWGSPDAVVGASGAISGLMGGAMRMVYGRFFHARLAPVLSRQILLFSLIWTIANIVTGVMGLGVGEELVLVAWVVHMGGYFAGLLTIGLFDALPSWRAA